MPLAKPLHRQDIATLYADHHGWRQGWLRKKLGSTASAADVAHDTFLRLLDREDAVAAREPRAFLEISQNVTASLHVNNLLDKKYMTGLGLFQTGFYGEPRNVMFTLRTKF